MARTHCRLRATQVKTLTPIVTRCPERRHFLWATNRRTVATLDAVIRLTRRIRRCPNPDCALPPVISA